MSLLSLSGAEFVREYFFSMLTMVCKKAELTPVAIAAGRQLGNRLFGPPELKESHLNYELIPSVVFSHPEVGSTGLTEPQAIERYGKENIKIYHTKFSAMYYDV